MKGMKKTPDEESHHREHRAAEHRGIRAKILFVCASQLDTHSAASVRGAGSPGIAFENSMSTQFSIASFS